MFLNLSYCENYPTVNIEAMACGTPVLTYKTGGSPEIVKEYNGYIVEQGDVDAVVKQIRVLKNQGYERVKIFKERFDSSQVANNYINLYYGITK